MQEFVTVRRLLALLAVCSLVFAACSGDDDSEGAQQTTSTTAARPTTTTTGAPPRTTTVAPATTVAACDPGAPPAAPSTGGNAGEPGLLGDLVVEPGDCADRVDFVFAADVPGYSIDYQPGPFTQDASGEPVTIAGAAFIVVRFEPAYSFDFETGDATYTGPRELTPGGVYVEEVENTGDFEAVMSWIIGVSQQATYTVTVSGSTLSIVIGNPG